MNEIVRQHLRTLDSPSPVTPNDTAQQPGPPSDLAPSKHRTAAPVCFSGSFGQPLNKAYTAEDKPRLPVYLPAATSQSFSPRLAEGPACRGQRLAVRAERHGHDTPRMPLEGGPLLAGRHVPQLDRLVIRLPEASVLPSGLNATDMTASVCPLRVARSLPVATSHSLIGLVAARRGQRLAVRAERHGLDRMAVCPLRVARSLPVATSHSLTVLSQLARGQRLAVRAERHGLTDHSSTSVCPLRVARSLPVATSHSLIVCRRSPRPASCRPG